VLLVGLTCFILQRFPNMLALEKKLKQTMKFQVLVARCGIALSLSGLWWQMSSECHSSRKKAESNILRAQHLTDISTRLPTVRSSFTTSGYSRSDPHGEDEGDGKAYLEKMMWRYCRRQWIQPPMVACAYMYITSTGLPLFRCCSLRTAVVRSNVIPKHHVKAFCDMTWTR